MRATSLIPILIPLTGALPTNLPLADISERSLASFTMMEKVSASAAEVTNLRNRALSSTTQNDVTDGTGCKAMTVLFARGTTEAGNMGSVAGPPFVQAVGAAMGGDVAVQGVDYPANIPGFLAGGDKAGSAKMAQLVGQVKQQCPQTKLVMAGYSQGGQLVHNAASMLSADETSFVSSAVIFGDPDNGQAVGNVPAAKTKVICHAGDNICAGGDLVLPPHLTYGQNAQEAAKFVTGK